jgi:hypothetical protein
MLRKLAPVLLLFVMLACRSGSGGIASPAQTRRAVPISPSASTPAGLVVGELERLPAYPTHVPPSVVRSVGAFPSSMRYAGEQNVAGQVKTIMTVTRFGEGHPAFSPTVLVGLPKERIEVVGHCCVGRSQGEVDGHARTRIRSRGPVR